MTCPKCNADRAHRSHRQGIRERLLIFTGRVPYRCHECGERFLVVNDGAFWASGSATSNTRISRQAKRRRVLREVLFYGLGLLILLAFVMFLARDRGPESGGN